MKKESVIFITGATSGIGRALALEYAAPGVTLLLAGRDKARLEEVSAACAQKGAVVKTAALPVTEREGWEKQLAAWDDETPIDTVIANAGISGGTGKAGGESEAQFREIMATNLDGTFNTVNPLIPRMRARKSGHIVLMSSMAGFRGLPSAPAYSVSKSAVRAYAEALRPLLAADGVKVSAIFPGFIKTPLTDANNFAMPGLMEPEDAAHKMRDGIARGKPVIAFPLSFRMTMMLVCALPRRLGDMLVAKAPKKN
ncbi:MAG: SDR family NAD(P)-dependent oxidoreductase [Alphaproteobacteria bacterium]|nr:SDR family NAD(P)-dependent oxidoreductase [Alphaproteobacteria bacterium]